MPPPRPIIFTALPVAFQTDGALSIEGNTAILRKCAASGVDGAFVLGTTGEFPSLSEAERRTLTRISLDLLPDKRVVVHVGAASLREVERSEEHTSELQSLMRISSAVFCLKTKKTPEN